MGNEPIEHLIYPVSFKLLNVFHQEDLQMTVKGGKHELTGMVSLGGFYNNMKKIETRKTTYFYSVT